MNTEFSIEINGLMVKIYMQSGFFDHDDISYPLHKHSFAEMHILLSGTVNLNCNSKDFVLNAGDVMVIPAEMMHKYNSLGKEAKRITFFIDDTKHIKVMKKITFPKTFLSLLCNEIQNYVLNANDCKLRALLMYICCDFLTAEKKMSKIPLSNRELIIEDFFTQNYNRKATVNELSQKLMLSTKQTEREVKRITGNTFTDEMSKRRINAAVVLMQTTDMSLSEISELVGYSSYCGFYKAYKKFLHHNKTGV